MTLVNPFKVRMLFLKGGGSECRPKQEKAENSARDLTVDVPDLVGHGEADDVVGVVHDEHLVHIEHLRGPHVSQGVAVRAALEADGLTPLVRPGLGGAVGQGELVVPGGGGGDHWRGGGEQAS